MSSRDPCVRAGKYFQEKKYEEALRAINQCKKEASRSKRKRTKLDPDTAARDVSISILEGNILYNLNKNKKAADAFRHALLLLKKDEYFKQNKETARVKGRVYYSLSLTNSNKEKRESFLIKAKEHFLTAKLYAEAIECEIRLINTYHQTGKKDKMVNANHNLLKLSRKLKDKKARAYVRGQAYLDLAKLEENEKAIMKYFSKAEQEMKNSDSVGGQLEVDYEKGKYFLDQGREEEGRELLARSLEKARLNDLVELETKIKYTLGIDSIKSGDLESAANNIIEALSIQADSSDPKVSASAKLELARIRFSNGSGTEDYEISLNLASSALDSFAGIGDKQGMALATELMGNIYVILGKSRLAAKVLKRSKNYYTELNDRDSLGRVYTISADAASFDKNSVLVVSNLKKALNIYNETNNVLGLTDVYQRFAIHYIKEEKDKKQAEYYVKKLRDLIDDDFPHETAKKVIENQLRLLEKALT